MTTGARIAAIIEVLEKIEQPHTPARQQLSNYFRNRRYIGSQDRRVISDKVFNILRHHARLLWWTNDGIVRHRIIASLILLDEMTPQNVSDLFNGNGYAPSVLTDLERGLANSLAGQNINHPSMSDALLSEVPDWLFSELKSNWSKNFTEHAQALNEKAPIDLRVNTLKTSCTRVLKILKNDGIEAQPTPLSPIGLRIIDRVNLQNSTAFLSGFIEVQDEGSQLISFLVDAKVGQKAVDFCAGSGGKTLALAASMKDGGPLIACDINSHRFNKMPKRLKRAGVSNVSRKLLNGLSDPWIEKLSSSANRVLLDAPCSGSGLWRRSPSTKWRLTPNELNSMVHKQSQILETGAKLVKPGGRLVYATCSIIRRENEEQIERFFDNHKNFEVFPIPQIWNMVLDANCPVVGPFINLTPAKHSTDGFFCAVMKRTA